MKKSIIAIAIATLVSGSALATGYEAPAEYASVSGAAGNAIGLSAGNFGTGSSEGLATAWSGSKSTASVGLDVDQSRCSKDFAINGQIAGSTETYAGGTLNLTGHANGLVIAGATGSTAAGYKGKVGDDYVQQNGSGSSNAGIIVANNGKAFGYSATAFEGQGEISQKTDKDGVTTLTGSVKDAKSAYVYTNVVGWNAAGAAANVAVTGNYDNDFSGSAGSAGFGGHH